MIFDINTAIGWAFVFGIWSIGAISIIIAVLKARTQEEFCIIVLVGIALTIGVVFIFEQAFRITQ